jgi:uncharacterized membrane protein YcfT
MQAAGNTPTIHAPATTAPKVRVDWVDYAKGICIFFVVMLHVNDVAQEWTHRTGWLDEVVKFARPFRMPDFFLIAGLFLASAMRRPWRRYLDGKVIHFLYFYILWMTLQFVVMDAKHIVRRGDGVDELVLVYLRRWIDPVGALWFIHMLPVFFVVTRLLRSVPPWIVWLGAAALHSVWAGYSVKTGWKVPDELMSRYVYFYSGYVLAPHVFRIAAWARERVAVSVGYLACWGVVNGLLVAAGWALWPVLSLALGYAGAAAVVIAAVLLARVEWTWPLRYLGQNSIVVYLGDFGVSLIVVRVLAPGIGDVGTLGLASTVVTIIGTIVLWRLALRTPARFMYVRPRWLGLDPDPPERITVVSPAADRS